jgi:DNA invertase Pin-like site-specific DNA recombinase
MKAIAYYRVSTLRQGLSGLGLDAQRTIVEAHVRTNAGRIVAAYTEIESGRRNDRPQLREALRHARALGAVLLVARLDRLARNVAFTSALLESGADFVACDNPHANKLTIHILAAIAEYESELISARTKAAMAAAKKRGRVFGAQDPRCARGWLSRTGRLTEIQKLALAERQRKAQEFRSRIVPIVRAMRQKGMGYSDIAATLNESGSRTRTGRHWTRDRLQAVMTDAVKIDVADA